MQTVKFTAMEHGDAEDYDLLCESFEEYTSSLPQRILENLKELNTAYEGYQISRYEHSLQTATRAYRNNENEEMIVAALVHDIGGTLAPYNHAALAAAILQPYVSEKVCWIVQHHDIFVKYYWGHHRGLDRYAREKYREHPYYQATIDFCHHYDQNSFDPNYDTLPLEFFEPMVCKIFARPGHHSPYLEE
ncbi:HD domain-containing protein [Roseofilum capinflatum]|uniref:HD domain-containing protein n=1 Tax=Roseofilum capinflatum BLCC-M114 TaxID=3022440 RepID=A0ABT7B660_9CYAN|nr:HD domain-containing protein [Roseofilum capinflatum]MDJ1174626.1 HD domain-containing protein [Roseofilum capinflatum BLCC-M114]